MKLPTLSSGYEDLSTPPSSQSSTSIAKTLYFVPLLPIVYAAYLHGADTFLSPENATEVKDMVKVMAQALAAAVAGGGPIALYLRSIMLTKGKVDAQKPSVPDSIQAGVVNMPQSTPQAFGTDFSPEDLRPPQHSTLTTGQILLGVPENFAQPGDASHSETFIADPTDFNDNEPGVLQDDELPDDDGLIQVPSEARL